MGKNAKKRRKVKGQLAIKGMHYDGAYSLDDILAEHKEDILVLSGYVGYKWEKKVGELTQDDIEFLRSHSIENNLREPDDDDIDTLLANIDKIKRDNELT